MKYSILSLLAIFTFTGCASSVVDEEVAPATTEQSFPPGAAFQKAEGTPCTEPTYRMLILDDKAFWVALPTPCDSRPYVFKGDPGPDEWQTLQDSDRETKERVIHESSLISQ